MSTISRRNFLKLAGAGTAGAGLLGTPLARSA
ncbi:MAG: twin-arginine translocation signal domain-containing protein, partial [Guyparkeria sp.]